MEEKKILEPEEEIREARIKVLEKAVSLLESQLALMGYCETENEQMQTMCKIARQATQTAKLAEALILSGGGMA